MTSMFILRVDFKCMERKSYFQEQRIWNTVTVFNLPIRFQSYRLSWSRLTFWRRIKNTFYCNEDGRFAYLNKTTGNERLFLNWKI